MRNILLMVMVATPMTIFALGSTQNQPAAPQHQTANMQMMQSCPMKVSGADLSATDVENGIALTVTTKSGDVADLRRRTENMAKMHSAPSTGGMHADMMPFLIKYEEVPNGARLTLTAKDPARLEQFRAKVRQHVEQMKKGDCSMMQGMMLGMMGGMKSAEPPKLEVTPKSDETDHSAHHPSEEKK